MSQEQDQSQKTEEPTAKRLQEARKKGDVATSREVQNWFMLFAGTLVLVILAPGMARNLANILRQYLAAPHEYQTDFEALRAMLGQTLSSVGTVMLLPALILVIAAAGAGLIQHGFLLAPERLKIDLKKLSPIAGAKRMFSLRALAEFIKGILKITIVGVIAVVLMWPVTLELSSIPSKTVLDSMDIIHYFATRMLAGVVSVLALIAGFDFMYQRFEHTKKLRMTKQEVKDEFKQTEGDPHVKARLRAIRLERARQRMMQAVPEADVVITNPTHYAVALKYNSDEMPAPKLIAKGVDAVAERIRATAEEHDVPIVENAPLARALFAGVELDQEVPQEHYQAVAEIIAYVMRLKGRLVPGSAD